MIDICGGSLSKGCGTVFHADILHISFVSTFSACIFQRFTLRYVLTYSRLSLIRDE